VIRSAGPEVFVLLGSVADRITTEPMSSYLSIAMIAYLLGSIPFGFLLVRIFRGQDIRHSGSGNIGATNVARSSPGLGIVTLLLDAGKGLLAVYLAMVLYKAPVYPVMCVAALFAVVGHIFPIWLGFRGGKGVATAVGGFLLVAPQAVFGALIVFLLVVLSTRYVSLGSVAAAATFPLLAWLFYRAYFRPNYIAILGLASLLVIVRHRRNLGRLLAGTEPRFELRRG
jgi:acyl phosphate:glycerol-3-phosphate acyltransferase